MAYLRVGPHAYANAPFRGRFAFYTRFGLYGINRPEAEPQIPRRSYAEAIDWGIPNAVHRLRIDAHVLSSVTCHSNVLDITISPTRLKELIFVSTSDLQWKPLRRF